MPHWAPGRVWDGEDVYVVGGGHSLESFDWDLIRDSRVIGCNAAYKHGAHIVDIVVFGDERWWLMIGEHGHKKSDLGPLASYGGTVVCCAPSMRRLEPWMLTMPRGLRGVFTDRLAWNGNTGSLGINMALILGARRVFLLGFDMKLGTDKQGRSRANYHEHRYEGPKPGVYPRFAVGLGRLADQLPTVFPGTEVINVTDCSALTAFPRVGVDAHFAARAA